MNDDARLQRVAEDALRVCLALADVKSQQELELSIECYETELATARAVKDAVVSMGIRAATSGASSAPVSPELHAALKVLARARGVLNVVARNEGDARTCIGEALAVSDEIGALFERLTLGAEV